MQPKTTGTTSTIFPVGTVLAFAGPVAQSVPAGWLVCDGSSQLRQEHPELHATIGHRFGGRGDVFNVPQLTGQFIRCATSTADIGTQQNYQTALPNRNFSTSIGNQGDGDSWNFAENRTQDYSPQLTQTLTVTVTEGGDLETVPQNKAVYFLIKAASTSGGQPVVAPVGSIVAYTGVSTPDAGQWAWCQGQSWPTQGKYNPLYLAIGYAHGQDGELMVLPDYQGYFLRGVDPNGTVDKYASSRLAPYNNHTSGNSGAQVGSYEPMYTALPTGSAFTIVQPNAPLQANGNTANVGESVVGGPTGVALNTLTTTGGDPETIPKNFAVDYYLAWNPPTVPGSDGLPVGAIIVLASAPDQTPAGYLPCNGASLPIASYEGLYSAIGFTFGPNNNDGCFPLPNYAGYFLRGLDRSQKIDVSPRLPVQGASPPTGMGNLGTYQNYATAVPGTAFNAQLTSCNSSDGGPGADEDSTEDTTTASLPWSGGDSETCPTNLHLAFYMKVTA